MGGAALVNRSCNRLLPVVVLCWAGAAIKSEKVLHMENGGKSLRAPVF